MTLTLKYFISLFSAVVAICSESMVVDIEQGRLRGFRYSGSDFFTFMSVPYATAPPGPDRFKAPLPAPVWMQTFDALETGQVCPQHLPLPKIREDCLVANIFVPDTNSTNLSVMVYVHGGANVFTSGDFFRFTKLVNTMKLIVVTFNYRLGVHGFLCLGTKDVPGNAGMKDQVALLRWVQRNIASFGGNPDDVTVTGCSSGGGSIDLLTLSPMARGLFQKAVIESGSCLGLSGVQLDPLENAKIYARTLNFTNVENITALEEFYKTASFELLTSNTEEIILRDDSTTLFGPCIEIDTGTGVEMFLPEAPWSILDKGNYNRIPLLYGYSEMEALNKLDNFDTIKERMNENFEMFLPGDLKFDSVEEQIKVAKEIKSYYFGDRRVCQDTIIDYFNYFTDISYVFPMLRSLYMRLEAGNETIYVFEYSFVDTETDYIPYTNVRAAGHCSHAIAIQDEDYTNETEEYMAMKRTMRELWVNFIIHGNPVPEGSRLPKWPPVDKSSSALLSPHMALNSPVPELKTTLLLENRARFWIKYYKKYHKVPIPPTHSASFSIIVSNIISLVICILILL